LSSDEKNPSFITIILRDLSCATNVNRLHNELEDNGDNDDDDNNIISIFDNDSNSNNDNSLKS
jgi:hypothetical protein